MAAANWPSKYIKGHRDHLPIGTNSWLFKRTLDSEDGWYNYGHIRLGRILSKI